MKRLKERTDSVPDTPEDVGVIGEVLKKLEEPSVEFVEAIKSRDLPRWHAVRYLPDVLFCLHMVFEVNANLCYGFTIPVKFRTINLM